MSRKIYSNVVSEDKTREVQLHTLEIMADTLVKSFGPMGSHTAIVQQNGNTDSVVYTKDGKTIAQNIVFKDPIERSVQDMITELTRYIVKEVGDGTTSAVLLCNNVFKQLVSAKALNTYTPHELIERLHIAIEGICKEIKSRGRTCTLDDIYDIAYTSTNGNDYIAKTIQQIYAKHGMEVYIDLGISNEVDCLVKDSNGMVIDTGFSNSCFVNNRVDNTADIRNANVYVFKDAIDTKEMLDMLDAILYHNLMRCMEPNSMYEPIPTVIMCERKMTPDASAYLDKLVSFMNQGAKIPLLIISQIHQYDLFEDIVMMCGAPYIKKYIDPEIQARDIENGLAPTPETIHTFCGYCKQIVSSADKTRFVYPKLMFKDDSYTEHSDTFNSLIAFLETELEQAKKNNDGIMKIGGIKRRINSLKGNVVDFLVGGITPGDREMLKASVEDAILNCRSAVKDGVGYGANYMAFKALQDMVNGNEDLNDYLLYITLYDAYWNLTKELYMSLTRDEKEVKKIMDYSIEKNKPLNIRTKQFDGKVLSSINSDIAVLHAIDKILTVMYTCNQYLVPSPMHNIYEADN